MRLALTVYSDFICPFCFLHGKVLAQIEEEEALDIRWVGVEIHPETPPAGKPLTFAGAYARKWDGFITPFADEHAMPIQFPAFLPNTKLAMLAAAHADRHGAGNAFHTRTLTAYWREGRDIGDPAVLADLLRACGVPDADPARWHTPEYATVVAANRDTSLEHFATGFPTTMLGEFPLMGLQTPRDLRLHLDRYRKLLAKRAALT